MAISEQMQQTRDAVFANLAMAQARMQVLPTRLTARQETVRQNYLQQLSALVREAERLFWSVSRSDDEFMLAARAVGKVLREIADDAKAKSEGL
jgi:hypothetical protein